LFYRGKNTWHFFFRISFIIDCLFLIWLSRFRNK